MLGGICSEPTRFELEFVGEKVSDIFNPLWEGMEDKKGWGRLGPQPLKVVVVILFPWPIGGALCEPPIGQLVNVA